MYNLLPFLLLLPSSLTSALLIPRQTPSTGSCNSSPSLCSKAYSSITLLGAHDSPFLRNGNSGSGTGGTGLQLAEAGNQNISSTQQLDLGARLLSAQVHRSDHALHLCHSDCGLLDAGSLSSWLGGIKGWLDAHPTDVITLLLVNSDNATPTDLAGEFTTAGIADYGFVPNTPGVWPTLQEMITANKRLVVFVNAITAFPEAPYLLNEFDYVFENAYNVTTPTGFSCTVDRPDTLKGQPPPQGKLGLMNHMLYDNMAAMGLSIQTPNFSAAKTSNAATGSGSLGESASNCAKDWGRQPWGVLVDFVDMGDAVKVVDGLNGVKDAVDASGGRKASPQPYTGDAPKKGGLGLGGKAISIAAVGCALLTSC